MWFKHCRGDWWETREEQKTRIHPKFEITDTSIKKTPGRVKRWEKAASKLKLFEASGVSVRNYLVEELS